MKYEVMARIQGTGNDQRAVLTNQLRASRGQMVVVIGDEIYDRSQVTYVYGLDQNTRDEVNRIARSYGFHVINL